MERLHQGELESQPQVLIMLVHPVVSRVLNFSAELAPKPFLLYFFLFATFREGSRRSFRDLRKITKMYETNFV